MNRYDDDVPVGTPRARGRPYFAKVPAHAVAMKDRTGTYPFTLKTNVCGRCGAWIAPVSSSATDDTIVWVDGAPDASGTKALVFHPSGQAMAVDIAAGTYVVDVRRWKLHDCPVKVAR